MSRVRGDCPVLTRNFEFSSGRGGEKTKAFAVISSHSNEGMLRVSLGPGGWRGLQAIRSHRVGEVAFAVVLVLLVAGSLNVAISPHADVGSPSPGTVKAFAGGSLPSCNPNDACTADFVAVRDVLGSAHPNQALIGSRSRPSSTARGIPDNPPL